MTKILDKELTPFEIAEGEELERNRLEAQRIEISDQRHAEYARFADPLFFGWQRGENSKEEWLDKIAQIRQDYPYPETEKEEENGN